MQKGHEALQPCRHQARRPGSDAESHHGLSLRPIRQGKRAWGAQPGALPRRSPPSGCCPCNARRPAGAAKGGATAASHSSLPPSLPAEPLKVTSLPFRATLQRCRGWGGVGWARKSERRRGSAPLPHPPRPKLPAPVSSAPEPGIPPPHVGARSKKKKALQPPRTLQTPPSGGTRKRRRRRRRHSATIWTEGVRRGAHRIGGAAPGASGACAASTAGASLVRRWVCARCGRARPHPCVKLRGSAFKKGLREAGRGGRGEEKELAGAPAHWIPVARGRSGGLLRGLGATFLLGGGC